MRNRTPDSNTRLARPAAGEPLESTDPWVYFVTEKGLRASGAARMMAASASLRQTAGELEKAAMRLNQEVPAAADGSQDTPARMLRRGTVCGRYRNEHRVPDVRLSGKWLRRAGFELGRKYQVRVEDGQLTIRLE